jgi:hypothetical protein
MKTLNQLKNYISILLFIAMALISCKKELEIPQTEYEAVMAPGVKALTFENGRASTNVDQGDILAVFSTAANTEQTFSYTIQGDFANSSQSIYKQQNASFCFLDNFLAYRCQSNLWQGIVSYHPKKTKQSEVGSTETFWTWDFTDLTLFPDLPSVQFTAILKAKGVYCDVYVDEHSTHIDNDDAEEIARQFDEVAYPIVTGQFGLPPEVEGSLRVAILLPMAFNGGMDEELNPNGWAAGAFNEMDQLPPSEDNPYSNHRNALYINPGLYNTSIPYFIEKWRPILSHEFQHLVNYRYFGTSESVPIDEGKALLAEILTGYGLPNGDYLMWANVVAYQNNPSDISLLQMALSDVNTLGSYGMGLLWICYLYDRFGSEVIYNMSTYTSPGLDAAEAVTGIPKQHLFAEWLQANIVNGKVNNKIFEYKTIDVIGDGGGKFFGTLNGFAALPEHAIPDIETQRSVHSYGLEYFRADMPGEVIIKGDNIKAFIIQK